MATQLEASADRDRVLHGVSTRAGNRPPGWVLRMCDSKYLGVLEIVRCTSFAGDIEASYRRTDSGRLFLASIRPMCAGLLTVNGNTNGTAYINCISI